MELRQLKYFVKVAELQHFGRAAEQLYISQPALSQQISQLEISLGVELFEVAFRKKYRKVRLTAAGAYFLEEAKEILHKINLMAANTQKLGLHSEPIRLGVYKSLLKERVSEFLGNFTAANLDKQVAIVEFENPLEVQEAILRKEIDQGFTLLPLKYTEIECTFLKTEKLCLIVPKSKAQQFAEKSFEVLAKEEKWVEVQSKFHPLYHEINELFGQMGIKRQIVQEVSALGLLISLVSAGAAIGFAPAEYDFSKETNIAVLSLNHTVFKSLEICYVLAKLKDNTCLKQI